MRTTYLLSLLSIFLFISLESCKYEEGPAISLRTKKSRVVNDWFLYEIITTEASTGKKEVETISYKEDEYVMHSYSKNGDYTTTDKYGGKTYTKSYRWEFTDKKKKLKHIYQNGETESAEILKLKNDEMWLKVIDDYFEYELHFREF